LVLSTTRTSFADDTTDSPKSENAEQTPAEQPPEDEAAPTENPFPGRAPAPSLDGGVEWFNTAEPISIADLRGKIVVLDFWTYCCINCIHVLPDLKFLEEKYPEQLVVIGVHAAKFENEKDSKNIREAILRYEIAHPVVNDAEMTIARKYAFSSWPTLVLIDPQGQFVGRASGEGNREVLDTVIGKMIEYHRAKGTLDESPMRFDLERGKVEPTPLRYPAKLVADEAGDRLFISDSNHNRIVIASLDGQLQEIIGTGAIGNKDGGYDEAQFDHPQGMVLVGDTLYVADTENHLLRAVDLKAKKVTRLAGTGVQARTRFAINHPIFDVGGPLKSTPLNSPWALTHLDGTLYIAMAGPHQLWQHKLNSDSLEVFAGSGREDIIDGPHETSALAQTSGITHDGKNLYCVDSEGSAVRKVTLGAKGTVTTLVGPHDFPSGQSLFQFDDIDGIGDEVRLQHPLGIVHHDGKLFVADTYNHKIKLVDIKTGRCDTWLGTGTKGNGLDPVELSEPAGFALAGETLFIADTNNHRLLKTNIKTKETKLFEVKGLTPPNPPKSEPPADTTPIVKLKPQSIKPGEAVAVNLQFELPEGFKINKLAPIIYQLQAKGQQSLLAEDLLKGKQEADRLGDNKGRFSLPLSNAGKGTFVLTVNYQYCREGAGGVCRYGRYKAEMPIEVAPAAKSTELSVQVAD